MLARRRGKSPENHQPVQSEKPGPWLRRLLSVLALTILFQAAPAAEGRSGDRATETEPEIPPSLLIAGFEPFSYFDFNNSNQVVFDLAQECKAEGWSCTPLTYLPVSETDPARAAELIQRIALKQMPRGGVIMVFGQTSRLNFSTRTLRLEYASSESSDSWLRHLDNPVEYRVDDRLYQEIVQALEIWEAANLPPDAERHFQSTLGADTSGGYICAVTTWELLDFAREQQEKGTRYLVLFIHVPATRKFPEVVSAEAAVIAQTALDYYQAHSEHPRAFLARVDESYCRQGEAVTELC